MTGRATSGTHKVTQTVTHVLSKAERQRRWRRAHPESHKAQQKAYRTRKREAEEYFEALELGAEARERLMAIAEANKALREHRERIGEAHGLARAAGLSTGGWLKSLPLPERTKYADLEKELVDSERLSEEGDEAWRKACGMTMEEWLAQPQGVQAPAVPARPQVPLSPVEAMQARQRANDVAGLQILDCGLIIS